MSCCPRSVRNHQPVAFAAVAVAGLALLWNSAAVAAEERPPFDVLEFRVLGNSVLGQSAVERAVYPLLGPHRTFDDVEQARQALESAYHDAGYSTVFVDIPEQEVTDGVVRLHVTEGRLSHVALSGAKYYSERAIRERLPEAQTGAVPNLHRLQAELTKVNSETADRAVVPVLKAGGTPGTVDLSLKVDDHLPLHVGLEVNNEATPDTSSLRASATLSYTNLFGRGDEFSFLYQTAPQHPRDVRVLAATYTAAVGRSDAKLGFVVIDSSSDVATVGALSVLGAGQIYGVRFTEPLGRFLGGNHSLTLGADYKRFRQSVQLNPDSSFRTPISYVNLMATYAGAVGPQERPLTLSVTANFGPRGLVNDPDSFANKRFMARPNYFFVRGDASYTQPLWHEFLLRVRGSGQFAVEPVIGNEQYSAAGFDGVRGYLEAEELGDRGLKGSVELIAPAWAPGVQFRLQPLVFFDAGRVSLLEGLPDEKTSAGLRSWGVGLNFQATAGFTGSVLWADPLRDGARTRRGDSRVLFLVRGSL